ncbi:hypothetical protein ABID97_002177 [Variovorax sp. OAS795]
MQAEAEAAGALQVAGPVERVPDAEILLPDRNLPGLPARLLAQHLRQRERGERC